MLKFTLKPFITMKIFFLIITFLHFHIFTLAQNDEAISSTGTWVQENVTITQVWDPDGGTYWPQGETNHYYMVANGDTLINGTTYHKLYRTAVDYDYSTGLITPLGPLHLSMFFRNDGFNRAYKMYGPQTGESLWYDFNYNEGDYQTFTCGFNTTDLYLNEIDTVSWCDTNLLRHTYTWGPSNPLMLLNHVQLLGSTENFLFPCNDDDYDRVLFFCPTNVDMEDIQLEISTASTDINEAESDPIVAYPNPHINTFKIKGILKANYLHVNLYDMHGRLLMKDIDPHKEINTSELQAGRYFVQVRSQNQIRTIPIIKQ